MPPFFRSSRWPLVPLVLCFCLLSCASAPDLDMAERTLVLPISEGAATPKQPVAPLTLVTINLAHGRQSSVNQMLVSTKKTYKNLDDIAAFLVKYDADVVALQEADSPSWWSGQFDHVDYLARQGQFPFYAYAEHAQLWMGNYGTAILSRVPIASALGLTFPATPPTASKGFTLAQIQWPAGPGDTQPVDVVSVHLDFSRESVRVEQLDELVSLLKTRHNPLIIMGDFNSEWLAEQYLVESIADKSSMHVYNAASEDLSTYKDKRLDWILLSKDLVFDSYQVAPDELSDHRAVIARVRFKSPEEKLSVSD